MTLPIPAALLPNAPTREQIDRFEAALLLREAQGYPGEAPTSDHFAPGVYVRSMFIPAGTALSGARHKTDHVVTFDGDISVWHEGSMRRITGHHTLVSSAGAKRIGFAHADTWCTCILPNPDNLTDVRALEALFVEDSHMLASNRPRLTLADLHSIEALQ